MKQHSVFGHKRGLIASRRGYAMVVLLVFVIMSLTLVSAAVHTMLIAIQSTSEEQLSRETLVAAESGVEEALLRTLRNPNYTGGNITIGEASVTIAASGSAQKMVTSTAVIDRTSHIIEVVADYSGTQLSIPSWSVLY